MNASSSSSDSGKILENLVFLEFKKKGKEVYYHKSVYECDFVITHNYKPIELVQVTETLKSEVTRERELNGIQEAMAKYKLKEGLIITLNENGTLKVPEGTIKIVSAWDYFSN